jgi:hypothetical protein
LAAKSKKSSKFAKFARGEIGITLTGQILFEAFDPIRRAIDSMSALIKD